MQITNQKPTVLSPIYDSKLKGDFDPTKLVMETVVEPLFKPLVAGTNVAMTDDNGNNCDENTILTDVLACLGDATNASAEDTMRDIFSQTLTYYDKNAPLSIHETFALQAGVKEQLDPPDPVTIYTAQNDVVPACKEFMSNQCSYEKMFASFAYFARPETLGFYFINDVAFDNFKTWLANDTSVITQVMSGQANKLLQDFQNLTLSKVLTESIILRNADTDNNEEFSFARVIVYELMKYAKQISQDEFGIMPFHMGELYCPKTIVFVNIERHAHMSPRQVNNEWKIINHSLNTKPQIISNRSLKKLTAATRQAQKAQGQAVAAQRNGARPGVQRAATAKFRKSALTPVDMTRLIKKVLAKMHTQMKSENSYKSVKMSYARANRRDPDNFNLQGKVVSTVYRPDIHIYLDTSGSISEQNYQDAVKACIKMARKLNVNLYFNSFSHVMTQSTLLKTKDRSVKEIYREFQKVPKVSGGTDYEQIWEYIEASKKRKRELSLIITDFEFTARSSYIKHPKNLYYLPISNSNWRDITYWAEQFCKSMRHIDPNIRKHILC